MVARAVQQFQTHPRRVAAALADPDAIERWASISLRVTGTQPSRLRRGDGQTVESALVRQRLLSTSTAA